ncbi:SdpA family antimicrobial peptide system protein [Sphingobacterium sp.]|uniref:SdpA family antimicrobial peptide system protein n=1 Tax=Sphingobacterium sp. TaxID=341027 RepID=UPI00258A8D04|nr:SdpA family antimicrobial peptide system protein [Sphingobacterium sp.]WET67880.1 MAG: SdpA family antimicrobial peptide system protein [Sphingobacterium sp.]
MRNFNFKKPLYVYVIWLFWCYLIYSTLISFTPINSSYGSYDYKKKVGLLWPQGWGFFTKNPREALVDVYFVDSHDTLKVNFKNFSKENYFGLSRKSRYLNYELSLMLNEISRSSWQQQISNKYFPNQLQADTVIMKQRLSYFKPGEYYFVQHKQIPLLWQGNDQDKNVPYLFAHIVLKQQ